jgi:hypothetical protein
MKNYLMNENESTTYQTLQDAVKAYLEDIGINIYIIKYRNMSILYNIEGSQVNNLILHLKKLGKEQTNPNYYYY